MYQCRVDFRRPLVAHDQPPEVIQPRVGALHNPPPPIATQAAAILMRGLAVIRAGGNDRLDAAGGQGRPDRVAIVPSVGNQPLRPVAGTPGAMGTGDVDRGQGRVQQGDFRWGCRRHVKSERSTRAINQYHKLCSLAPLGVVDFGPPFLAGTKVPSTKHSSHRICSRSWSWARKARQSFSSVPSSVQRCNRSWTVLLGPYRRGSSLHWAPVHKIHKIPSKQCRAAAGGRPPRGFCCGTGNCSLIFCHCSSASLRHVIPAVVPLVEIWPRRSGIAMGQPCYERFSDSF